MVTDLLAMPPNGEETMGMEEVEMWVIFKGLHIAWIKGYPWHVIIECDSESVVIECDSESVDN